MDKLTKHGTAVVCLEYRSEERSSRTVISGPDWGFSSIETKKQTMVAVRFRHWGGRRNEWGLLKMTRVRRAARRRLGEDASNPWVGIIGVVIVERVRSLKGCWRCCDGNGEMSRGCHVLPNPRGGQNSEGKNTTT